MVCFLGSCLRSAADPAGLVISRHVVLRLTALAKSPWWPDGLRSAEGTSPRQREMYQWYCRLAGRDRAAAVVRRAWRPRPLRALVRGPSRTGYPAGDVVCPGQRLGELRAGADT